VVSADEINRYFVPPILELVIAHIFLGAGCHRLARWCFMLAATNKRFCF
jgi:hypothetical protein